MTLKEHIDDIRDNLEKSVFINEAAVCDYIVRRLLVDALDWPRHSPNVVIREYGVEGTRVDFALCNPPLKPRVFIEVKKVGNIEGGEKQLFQYAFHEGVPIAILTDGQKWQFFYPIGEGDYRERKAHELDLIQDDSEESAKCFDRYLNYEAICTDEAVEAIKQDYEKVVQQRQVAIRLPEAWNKLVEEADEFLLHAVAEKTESLCGYRPTDEQVLDFLRNLERKTEPVSPNPVPTPKPTPTPASTEESIVWEAVQKVTKGNRNTGFKVSEIEEAVSEKYPNFDPNKTITRKWLRASTVNFPSRSRYPKRPDRYRWKDKDDYYLL